MDAATPRACLPVDPLLRSMVRLIVCVIELDLVKGASSISIVAIVFSCIMNVRASSARPRRGGWPPSPRHMAQRIVLFPVPFGPITTLRL